MLAAAASAAAGYAVGNEETRPARQIPAVAPTVVIEEAPESEVASELGFPAFATRNTTRAGGATSAAVAAGVALASYPSVAGVGRPPAVVLAPTDSWQLALAATSLTSAEIGAPMLVGEPDAIPGFTVSALEGLAPDGLDRADGAEVIAIGDEVAAPSGFEELRIEGTGPAAAAKAIDRQRARLSGIQDPDNILVVSSQEAAFAMPAAAWAARSGDPIAFASDEVPEETIEMIERHPKAKVYVLGPEEAVNAGAMGDLREASGSRVERIEGKDPVDNAIAFARFSSGDFGWDINDPGHGFTVANADRPLDAAVASPLAAGGKPGPLLLTDSAERMPASLREFLLDTKPGFSEDPARAIYNHIWLIGDEGAVSVELQAQIDELTKLVRVSDATGGPRFGIADEAEPDLDASPDQDASPGPGSSPDP